MAHPAALPKLSDFPADYVSADIGSRLKNAAIVMTVLEIAFVGLRTWSKAIGGTAKGPDDWLVVAALVYCLGLNVTAYLAPHLAAIGRHLVVVELTSPEKLATWAKYLLVMPLLWEVATTLPKIAILVLYSRIFTLGRGRIANYMLMGLVVVTWLAMTLALLLQCIPLEYLWNRKIKGKCFNIEALDRYVAIPNLVEDLLILVLPMPYVWSLHSSVKAKLGLTITFLAGSFGMVVCIIRTTIFFSTPFFSDSTWTAVNIYILLIVEPGCYLIATCLVNLRPLFKHVIGRISPDASNEQNSLISKSMRSIRSLFGTSTKGTTTSESVPGIPLSAMDNRQHSKFTKLHARSDRQFLRVENEEILIGDK